MTTHEMQKMSRNTQLEEDIMVVMEEYLETKLFRDANIPEVNQLFHDMYSRVADVAVFYAKAGNPNGYTHFKGSE